MDAGLVDANPIDANPIDANPLDAGLLVDPGFETEGAGSCGAVWSGSGGPHSTTSEGWPSTSVHLAFDGTEGQLEALASCVPEGTDEACALVDDMILTRVSP